MSAKILSIDGVRAFLPEARRGAGILQALRDDFECAFAILKYAVEKDLPAFTFSGLRFPPCLKGGAPPNDIGKSDAFAIEMVIFQEHLHDRITLLAQNRQMLREIWALNERTRQFRQMEIRSQETRCGVIDELADLVARLSAKDENLTIAALERCCMRRIALIDSLKQNVPVTEFPS